jgi:hypothetical protein
MGEDTRMGKEGYGHVISEMIRIKRPDLGNKGASCVKKKRRAQSGKWGIERKYC